MNDHDNTNAHAQRLDAKADLMVRKFDELLSSSDRENRHALMENSRQANGEHGDRSYAGAQSRSRTSFESNHMERPRAAPSRAGRTNPVPSKAQATSAAQLPTMPQVRSVPDLTTIWQDTTMYASMFELLNRSLETFITKLSKSTERGAR